MAVALAARLTNIIDSKLALANIITRLSRNRATLSALVIYQALNLVVGVPGGTRSAVLVESAHAALRAVRAGNLLCLWVSHGCHHVVV